MRCGWEEWQEDAWRFVGGPYQTINANVFTEERYGAGWYAWVWGVTGYHGPYPTHHDAIEAAEAILAQQAICPEEDA